MGIIYVALKTNLFTIMPKFLVKNCEGYSKEIHKF